MSSSRLFWILIGETAGLLAALTLAAKAPNWLLAGTFSIAACGFGAALLRTIAKN